LFTQDECQAEQTPAIISEILNRCLDTIISRRLEQW